jgi:hypothetical protein
VRHRFLLQPSHRDVRGVDGSIHLRTVPVLCLHRDRKAPVVRAKLGFELPAADCKPIFDNRELALLIRIEPQVLVEHGMQVDTCLGLNREGNPADEHPGKRREKGD